MNNSTIKPTIVLGLGNPLMADEGIGTRLVELLAEKYPDFPDVDFTDAGTGGMALMTHFSGRKKAILIDCALMGTEPGTIIRFTPEDVTTVKKLAHQSLHEADILKIIELAKQFGECPDEIVLFGIEPVVIEQRMELSPQLENNLGDYVAKITEELKK
jgi:hydrogenase maturation protease